jgi:hypothetical protein
MSALKCSNPECCSNTTEPDNRYFNVTITVDASRYPAERISKIPGEQFERIHCGAEAVDDELEVYEIQPDGTEVCLTPKNVPSLLLPPFG